MNILGLPGVKAVTKPWLESLLAALADGSVDSEILAYRHWRDAGSADPGFEASRLRLRSVDLVIAKSLGTLIATRAFDEFAFNPRQAVLIGCPLRRHGADQYASLRRFVAAVPTLFIQQTSDFNGSFADLSAAVATLPNASLAEVPGDDHVYADIETLARLIRPRLKCN